MKRGLPPDDLPEELSRYNAGEDPRVKEARQVEQERLDRLAAEQKRKERIEQERRDRLAAEAETKRRKEQEAREARVKVWERREAIVEILLGNGACFLYAIILTAGFFFVLAMDEELRRTGYTTENISHTKVTSFVVFGSCCCGIATIPILTLLGVAIRHILVSIIEARIRKLPR